MDIADSKHIIEGKGIDDHIAIGKAVIFENKSTTVTPKTITKKSVQAHKKRFTHAKKTLLEELDLLSAQISDKGTEEIIEAQKQIVSDPEIENAVHQLIEDKLINVDFAVYQTYCQFIERLKESGSGLFRQRIVDLEDLRDRFVNIISNTSKRGAQISEDSIIVTKDISPTDLVAYYEDGIKGLIIEKGGTTSHAAIIAKSLGIPCMVNVEQATKGIPNRSKIILDARSEKIFVNPSPKIEQEYQEIIEKLDKGEMDASTEIHETKDGIPFQLLANIEFEAEVPQVSQYNAKGVGLLRTESLLFGHRLRKSVEEQEVFYNYMVEGTTGDVIIRLFDIGGDKNSSMVNNETNPFLGWRGIRLLLDQKELLENQLTAILKTAGKHPGRIKILVPMVSVIEEVHQIKDTIRQIEEKLRQEGHELDTNLPFGLMVEVPSVAISAEVFAREVDFFSIGTNDLTQYTLAVDRGNERISQLFQHYHPSVLSLIKQTVEGAARQGVPVSLCGELASDKIGAACAFGMGISNLSMVPRAIPKIRALLGEYTTQDFQELAKKALQQTSAENVKSLFEDWKASRE